MKSLEEKHKNSLTVIKKLFENFKNGNAEKFYGNDYAQVPLKSTILFKGLSCNIAATLVETPAHNLYPSSCLIKLDTVTFQTVLQ